jgi:hypothetical protein
MAASMKFIQITKGNDMSPASKKIRDARNTKDVWPLKTLS